MRDVIATMTPKQQQHQQRHAAMYGRMQWAQAVFERRVQAQADSAVCRRPDRCRETSSEAAS